MSGYGAERQSEANALIQAMYAGKVGWAAQARVRAMKRDALFAAVHDDPEATDALCRLVYNADLPERLLSVEPALPVLGSVSGNTAPDALLHLALRHRQWLRGPEMWEIPPAADTPADLLHSLVRHLLCRYPLPRVLDAAWFSGDGEMATRYREWFVHLGSGGKREELRFPMPMTHRAAHFFLLAPDAFPLPAAMRYGQIRALGGPEALAQTLAETFLTELQTDEPFWFSFVQFLVNHPALPLSQIGPLADFVRFRKFGSHGQDAPEPAFTLKGRTPEALMRRMDEWHAALARLETGGRKVWSASGIAPLEQVEPDTFSSATCRWRIIELTHTLALAEEGRAMRNCVRTYQAACVRGDCSIWALRMTLSDTGVVRHMLTIEVNSRRRAIVQVRASCNQSLTQLRHNVRMMRARDLLIRWAHEQHLSIAASI